MALTFDDVVAATADLPGTEVSTWYGTPGVKVGGKGFCRMWGEREYKRDGIDDTDVLVVMCDIDEKSDLIAAADGALFSTPHYEGHGTMLIRLADVHADDLAGFLLDSWLLKASGKLIKQFEESRSD